MTELHATTGYFSEVLKNDEFYGREQIHALMAYLSDLGVTHYEWLTKQRGIRDLDSHHDFDLLSTVVDAAHANGLTVSAVFKPFEGAMGQLPHTFPRPEGVPWLDHETGIAFGVDPFVAEHPELRLRRRPGETDPGGPITTVRLLSETDAPTRVSGGDLTVLSSDTIAGFEPCEGPVEVEERVEWRSYFPSGRECRLLELTGLDIPREDRFVAVECANTAADGHGDFTNELGRMVELENAAGEAIPTTPGLRSVSDRIDRLSEMVCRTTPYLDHPDVREALETSLPDDLYTFETHGVDATRPHTLDDPDEGQATGTVAVMRGKPEYLLGNLSPAYEAVRDHWLDLVEEFIAAGVDGVNVRLANHTRSHEHYEYGYNEPVCDRAGDLDHAAVARRNGEAYTAFLREAAELLDANGCEIGVHLSNEIFADDGRPHGFRGTQGVMHIPRNVEWQWRTWIGEFADYVELRGFGNNRRWRRDRMVDRIAAAIAESDRSPPLVYQSERTFDVDAVGSDPAGPFEELRAEVEYATDHPAIDAWNLYETRDVTRLSGDGSLVGSRQYADFLSEYFDPSA